MRRQIGITMVCGVLFLGGVSSPVFSHPGHAGTREALEAQSFATPEPLTLAMAETDKPLPAASSQPGITGQGKYRFRLLYGSQHLPPKAVEVLKQAHGGFAVDRRHGKGEVYFALPKAGIIQISGDLKTTKLLDTDEVMRAHNEHNTLIWYADNGTPYLAFPSDDAGKIFTTTLDGKLIHTLDPPTPNDDLGNPTANEFFKKNQTYKPTDVEQLDGLYYITTGYTPAPLDFVLTAKITFNPFQATWNKLCIGGGKGDGPGQFGTGHGITIPKGKKRLDIADRPHSEIDRFTPEGKYLETVSLPKGSLPCDTFYEDKLTVVGCLEGPDRTKGAPIYILENDKLVSTLMPKEDLGLENFAHVHNAVCVVMHKNLLEKKLYVIAQAWNPGDFAILEQVND